MGTKARASRIDPAEYRRYLEDRLSRTRARIKMADAVTGLTIVAVTWVCYLLLVVMLDQIIELPSIVRFMLLVTCLIVTGGILVLRVILPSLNQVNTRFAARSIEKADQRMKNSVLSWVELSEHPEDLPTPILRTIENKAASDLSRVRIEDAIQPRHVLSALYILASVVVLFCLYSFFTTKSFGASIERVLLPLGATAPPTATQLRITFDPGQADPTEPTPIPAESSITFKATVIRGNPAQVMAYLQADGSDYEEPHELSRSTTVQSEFTLSLHQRQKTFHVRFVANDFHSKQYTIAVTPAPMITEWLLRYTPPSYTGAAPFTSPTPDITGLEGTEVVVEAVTNLPVAASSARIEFKLARPMASVDMKLMEGSENRIEGKFTLTGDGSYSVLFSDKEGRAPLFRPSNNIRVLKDLPPVIEFSRPAEVESSLPANRPLILAARVKDDIGLRHIMLTIRKKGSEDAPIIFEQGGRPGDVLGQSEAINESVDLTKFKLIPGDVVEYWIEAEDNKLPASNTASTRADSRIVKITKPLEAAPPAKDGERKNATQAEENDPQKKGEKADDANPKDDEKSGDEPSDSNEKSPGEGKEPSDKNNPSADSDPNKEDQKNESNDANGNQPGEKSSDEEATANDLKKEPGKEGKRQEANGKKADENNANNLSEEDRRDLDKLREYFKKKNGSKEEGNAKESKNTPSDSKNREAATPSKEISKDQNAGPEDKLTNKDQWNDPGESPAGPKKGDGAPSPDAAKSDANKPEGSKEGSAEQKEASEEKKNSEEQTSQAGTGDKSKSAGSSKSGESKKNDAKPNGNGAGGSDEEKKPSEANEPKASEKNETPATDNEKSPSEPKTGRKPTDENQAGSKGDNSKSGSKGQEKSSPQGDSSKSPGNGDSSQKSGESKDKASSSDGEKSPNADEKASPKEGDKAAEEKQSKAGSEGRPNSSSEKQSSSGGEKQSGQESQSQSGESGSSDDSSEKDGKQNKESKEGKPTPGSEGENDKPSKRSTKVGNDESSAASKGNSDGSSQEGPSQSPGQKGPGSPSDQKGNESKGPGEKQRAEGDKSTEGGEKGTTSEQSAPTDNKEKPSENQQSSEKQPSGEKQEEEKPSSSKDSKESGSKEGEQKGSESKSTASDGKQGSQGKPSNSGGQQKGSEGNQQSANSSSSKESKEGSPSKDASDSKSSDSSESSDKQSPPKDEEKSSDSKESGSKESEQSKKQNEGSPKGSSSSNNNDSKDAKPADDSSKNGSADAHQTGSATQPSGGKRANPTSDKGDGGVLDNSGDQADPDDLKKGSNLILKKLQDQMANKKVDPDLLKSMGWTEEDARKFYERLQKEQQPAENVAPVEREQRRQFGQGTDLRKSTGKGAGTRNDSIQDLHSGRRTPVPPQVRKRFEAYMKSLSETSSGKPADKPPAPPAAGTK